MASPRNAGYVKNAPSCSAVALPYLPIPRCPRRGHGLCSPHKYLPVLGTVTTAVSFHHHVCCLRSVPGPPLPASVPVWPGLDEPSARRRSLVSPARPSGTGCLSANRVCKAATCMAQRWRSPCVVSLPRVRYHRLWDFLVSSLWRGCMVLNRTFSVPLCWIFMFILSSVFPGIFQK